LWATVDTIIKDLSDSRQSLRGDSNAAWYVLLKFCLQKLQAIHVLLEDGPKPSGQPDVMM
jgi:hypothetical protein